MPYNCYSMLYLLMQYKHKNSLHAAACCVYAYYSKIKNQSKTTITMIFFTFVNIFDYSIKGFIITRRVSLMI